MTKPGNPRRDPGPNPVSRTGNQNSQEEPTPAQAGHGLKSKDYGLSFRYPVHYTVKEGEETDSQQTNAASEAMNFAQPGGMTLSTIELPEKLYSGTDFESAFFTVNVNPKMTADECSEFASSLIKANWTTCQTAHPRSTLQEPTTARWMT